MNGEQVFGRLSKDEYFMSVAILAADRSTCITERSGAVLVRDGKIISVGYSGVPSGQKHCLDAGCLKNGEVCVNAVRSEMSAILQCAINAISSKDTVMYSSSCPLYENAKSLVVAGIKKLFYLSDFPDQKVLDYLKNAGVEVTKLEFAVI